MHILSKEPIAGMKMVRLKIKPKQASVEHREQGGWRWWVPRDMREGWTMEDPVAHLQDFGLYPKNIGKPLQVYKLMICVYVLNFKSSLLNAVLAKVINSRSQKNIWLF